MYYETERLVLSTYCRLGYLPVHVDFIAANNLIYDTYRLTAIDAPDAKGVDRLRQFDLDLDTCMDVWRQLVHGRNERAPDILRQVARASPARHRSGAT